MDPIEFLVHFIGIFRRIIVYAILFRIILSWISMGAVQHRGRFTMFIYDMTDPVINLARRLPHRIGMLDFAPLVAMVGVDLLSELLIILIVNVV